LSSSYARAIQEKYLNGEQELIRQSGVRWHSRLEMQWDTVLVSRKEGGFGVL
jgi:hypothetical protein